MRSNASYLGAISGLVLILIGGLVGKAQIDSGKGAGRTDSTSRDRDARKTEPAKPESKLTFEGEGVLTLTGDGYLDFMPRESLNAASLDLHDDPEVRKHIDEGSPLGLVMGKISLRYDAQRGAIDVRFTEPGESEREASLELSLPREVLKARVGPFFRKLEFLETDARETEASLLDEGQLSESELPALEEGKVAASCSCKAERCNCTITCEANKRAERICKERDFCQCRCFGRE